MAHDSDQHMQSNLYQEYQVYQEVSLADRMFGWWYSIAAPPEVPDEALLRDRMRVRRGKLTSVIFLIELINTVLNLIVVLQDAPFAVPPLIVLLVTMLLGIILNRAGKTVIAGTLVIVVFEVGLILNIFATPGGLSPFLVSIFDIFLTIDVIAASLLASWVVLPLTLGNCLLVAALITFMPKTPAMLQVLHIEAYSVYADPIVLQVVTAFAMFLWVNSTFREMRRAGNAEEVNKLTMELAQQQQVVQEEKQQLEESIQQIVAVHTRVANGDFNARVPLDQQNVLWSVAGSLNNLLSRLQRWRQDAARLQRNEQAIAQLLYNVQVARRYGVPLPSYKTGTSIDALITEISKGVATPQPTYDQYNNYR